MRINTNVSAINAQRQLGITNTAVSQSITRLSSGFRINRAADDAAGLGIANKLRGNIRSMTQAARNGEQANSLAQIAEGAVGGIAKMLDRMKELATQANSDTVDDSGRSRLQAEFNALRDEIDRTVATTKFGDVALINGGFGSTVAATGLNDGATAGIQSVTSSGAADGDYVLSWAGGDVTLTQSSTNDTQTVELTDDEVQTLNFSNFGITIETSNEVDGATLQALAAGARTITIDAGVGSFMVGSSGSYDGNDLLTFSAVDLQVSTLGLQNFDLTDPVGDPLGAQEALKQIDTAIGQVNSALGSIGAFQNRVENAVANLKTGIENLSASESVIRDLDMAEEMTRFSKNQILAQAGTAMLAQANSSSQNVLQLLRG